MRNSIMDTLFSSLQNNPSVAAGTCTFAIAFALVAGNAFYAQSGSHPDPIWATRDLTTTQSITPMVKPVKVSKYAAKQAPLPTNGDAARDTSTAKPQRSELVASVQQALLESGDFSGTVDGLIGPVTRNSIVQYQKRHDMEPTGNPSEELLSKIYRDTPTIVSASNNDPLKSLISGNNNASSDKAAYDRNIVKKIQAGIVNAGIATIEADGVYGSKTEAAISDFQLKNKLEVTGKPNIDVLEKLITLGHV
ncbi:MAG: peptidoglycan-binding domain-containing protein [Salaquimonas sp.]